MIEIENINKSFGKLKVLDNVNLSCKKGECIALIGPNACGKTTLIKSILGMVISDSGVIKFNGHSIHKSFEYRASIGYMPQIGRYPDNMSISGIVEMVKDIRNHKGDLDEELFEKFRLKELGSKFMRTLSGGTTQNTLRKA